MNKEQKNFHKSRRKEFIRLIGKDSIAVIFGSTHQNKSYDGDFKFKQFKNFYYLTGFEEPNSAIVVAPNGINIKFEKSEKNVNEVLFVQKKDPFLETWTGKRMGYENVKEAIGIENSKLNSDLSNILSSNIFDSYSKLYLNFGEMLKLKGQMEQILTSFINNLNLLAPNIEIIDASYILGKMRAVKTEFEVKKIQHAANISITAYNEILKIIKPGVNEYEVQATLEYFYKYKGGEDLGYYPIVASGENACILHYESNNQLLQNDELLLIDSAAEYNYYSSDISRTFPVNGKYSTEQKMVYEIVLRSNKECIKKVKPGVKLSELKQLNEKILADGLNRIGLLKNKKNVKNYSLHGVGHHIGLDTHDAVPSNKTLSVDNDSLKPGNVITIEPGLYFNSGSKDIPKKFRGMGIRIEDDILVTKSGHRNLTEGMIKEVEDIERMMR